MKCKHLFLVKLYLPENTWPPRLFAVKTVDWILAAKYYCLAIMLFACLLLQSSRFFARLYSRKLCWATFCCLSSRRLWGLHEYLIWHLRYINLAAYRPPLAIRIIYYTPHTHTLYVYIICGASLSHTRTGVNRCARAAERELLLRLGNVHTKAPVGEIRLGNIKMMKGPREFCSAEIMRSRWAGNFTDPRGWFGRNSFVGTVFNRNWCDYPDLVLYNCTQHGIHEIYSKRYLPIIELFFMYLSKMNYPQMIKENKPLTDKKPTNVCFYISKGDQ